MQKTARRTHAVQPCQGRARDKRRPGDFVRRRHQAPPKWRAALHPRPFLARRFVAIDCETTGLDAASDQLIEIAWTRYEGERVIEERSRLICFQGALPANIRTLTGLHPHAFVNAQPFGAIAPDLMRAIEWADFVVAYNAPFDRAFIARALHAHERTLPSTPWLDPMVLARAINRVPGARMNLRATCARYGIQTSAVHRALSDAKAAGALLFELGRKLAVVLGASPALEDLLAIQATMRLRQAAERKARHVHDATVSATSLS